MEQRITRRDLPIVLGFLLPGGLLMAALIAVPLVLIVQYSMTDATSFTSSAQFIGMENYAALAVDQRFWGGVVRTLIYAGGSVLAQIVIGMIFALLLNQRFPGMPFLRGAAVVPYIVPTVVVTIAFQWILDADSGIVNGMLRALGLSGANFLSIDLAIWTSIALSVWTWTPFCTLVFLSGLQTVPDELHESAQVDGAGMFRRFFTITLPMLRGLIVTVILLRGIWMFNKFDLIYLLTGGGPLESTETLPVYSYIAAFKLFDVGRGSAIAVVMFLVMLVAMLVYLRLFDRDANESRRVRRAVRLSER